MPVQSLFPTKLYRAPLQRSNLAAFNRELTKACLSLAREDRSGRRWSQQNNYPGYTSYASLNDLPWRFPSFAALQKKLDRHAGSFARVLKFDLTEKRMKLDSLWVNVLDPRGVHSGHIHPHAALSGTYYVSVPKGAGALKIEDPRLPLMMAAPKRSDQAGADSGAFVYLAPVPGEVLLWESWLRHEVVAGIAQRPRISISFNYAWL